MIPQLSQESLYAAIAESGVNVDTLKVAQEESLDMIRDIQVIPNFMFFTRYIVNLINSTCERAVTIPNLRGSHAILMYQKIISKVPITDAKSLGMIVESFLDVFNTGFIKLPGTMGLRFHIDVLRNCYSADEQVFFDQLMNEIKLVASDPKVMPEYNFLADTIINQIKSLISNPVLLKAVETDHNELIKGVVSSMESGNVQGGGFIDSILTSYRTIHKSLLDDSIDKGMLLRTLLFLISPIVKALSRTSPTDAIIYEKYYELLTMPNITALTNEDWYCLKNELITRSQLMAKLNEMLKTKISLLEDIQIAHSMIG